MADRTSIKIGILGLGGIGDTHARALAALAEAGSEIELAAFSGGSTERAAAAGWPDARRRNPTELINDPDLDVIAICTPSALHAGQAEAALRAGKHVVVEKPMALSTEDARTLRDLAAERKLIISPIAQRRHEPLNIALKKLIDSGRLGRVVLGETFVHWYRSDAYYTEVGWRGEAGGGGGSLMNQGLHNVDLLCWLLGEVRTVTGATATLGHDIAVEDTTVGCLQFAGGALGVIATTTATPPGVPSELAIWTSTGSVRLDQTGITSWEFADVQRPADPEVAVSGASDPAAIGISGHLAQWADVIDALRAARQPMITADDGVRTVAVLDGIYRAADTGRSVAIDHSRASF